MTINQEMPDLIKILPFKEDNAFYYNQSQTCKKSIEDSLNYINSGDQSIFRRVKDDSSIKSSSTYKSHDSQTSSDEEYTNSPAIIFKRAENNFNNQIDLISNDSHNNSSRPYSNISKCFSIEFV